MDLRRGERNNKSDESRDSARVERLWRKREEEVRLRKLLESRSHERDITYSEYYIRTRGFDYTKRTLMISQKRGWIGHPTKSPRVKAEGDSEFCSLE